MRIAPVYRFMADVREKSYGAIILFPPGFSDFVSTPCTACYSRAAARGRRAGEQKQRNNLKGCRVTGRSLSV